MVGRIINGPDGYAVIWARSWGAPLKCYGELRPLKSRIFDALRYLQSGKQVCSRLLETSESAQTANRGEAMGDHDTSAGTTRASIVSRLTSGILSRAGVWGRWLADKAAELISELGTEAVRIPHNKAGDSSSARNGILVIKENL